MLINGGLTYTVPGLIVKHQLVYSVASYLCCVTPSVGAWILWQAGRQAVRQNTGKLNFEVLLCYQVQCCNWVTSIDPDDPLTHWLRPG